MAIICPKCGAQYDVTLFQFGRTIVCSCGQVVDAAKPHLKPPPLKKTNPPPPIEGNEENPA